MIQPKIRITSEGHRFEVTKTGEIVRYINPQAIRTGQILKDGKVYPDSSKFDYGAFWKTNKQNK